ncbi:hypothetical protein B0H11DRAFT_2197046 [Mycena galericulata]|nr:hypothetical protein B0H11DRAFT_2361408 [Mycena galericulata]KAJ7468919.1 hypothetical protein B0H11DRAFT_2197046 [Mycena galericulata]
MFESNALPPLTGLDFAAQVTLLVAEVQRRQPSRLPPASTTPEADERQTLDIQRILEDRLASPMDDEPGLALFFVGMQIPQGRRVFVDQLSTAPPDHTLLHRLGVAIPILGRTLHAIQDREHFFVGTTSIPVDVSADYMNHVYSFHELGSWADLEQPGNMGPSILTPAFASAERSALLTSRGLSDAIPISLSTHSGNQESDTVWSAAPAPTLALPSIPMPPVPAASHASATGSPTPNSVAPACAAFLQDRFSNRLALIQAAQTAPYGTAYHHCMQERHFMAICNSLGLNLNLRVFTSVSVEGGLQIHYDDVVATAGLNVNTFGGTRTTVTKARDARRRLARYKRGIDTHSILPLANEEGSNESWHDVLISFLPVLDAMLRESDIDDSFLSDTSGSAEAQAIGMGVEAFKAKLAKVMRALPA